MAMTEKVVLTDEQKWDWPTTVAEFERKFGEFVREARRAGIRCTKLRGSNFMTPEYLGTVACEGHAVEITTGHGMDNQRFYGVTFDARSDLGERDPRSSLCHSLDEVWALLYG